MDSVIILTHGWTGSSVFSALLGQAGCWLGSETIVKPDYDTHENADLVVLNETLLQALAPTLDREHRFAAADVLEIERRGSAFDLAPYRAFADHCEGHRPWLWKDPRLTWTIRLWERCLDLRRVRFLVLTRDPTQAWITANVRRHVQSPRFTRAYNDGITQSNLQFLRERGLPHLQSSFEDLLLRPEQTLAAMNAFFGITLTMEQLRGVCREPLHRKSRGWTDFVVASLIYLKNYRQRDGRSALARPA